MRPMTQARKDAAIAAGASLGALPSVEMGSSCSTMMTDDDTPSHSPVAATSPAARFGLRRGRSAERRPISPVVHMRSLPAQDDQEEADLALSAARKGSYLPGASVINEPMSHDPAQELDAHDLDLPTDEHGHEIHSARGALRAELPLLLRSTIPVCFTQLAEYSLSLASVISIGHLGTEELAASS